MFPLNMKPVTQFGAGVYELRESFDTKAYRVVYVVNLGKALYVLHAFMKKSKSGIALPKPDVALIDARLKRAGQSGEGRKQFFFEKKNQKTFAYWARLRPERGSKSFLLLFFKKEDLSIACLPSPDCPAEACP